MELKGNIPDPWLNQQSLILIQLIF